VTDQQFVLPADVRIFRLSELDPAIRSRLAAMSAELPFGITRVGSRKTTKLLDEAAAGLLAEFRAPSSVVDAVLRYSQDRDADPELVLEAAFALLRTLVAAGFLVTPGAALDTALAASLRAGDCVGKWHIRHALRVLRDTEVYLADDPDGTTVVIKLITPDAEPWIRRALGNEVAVLTALGGSPAPRLLAAELDEAAPYLVLEHCQGRHADAAAAELRRPWVADSRKAVLALCQQIARAYAALHDQGVIHGDVNPNNVLVDVRTSTVRLLDFGFARRAQEPGQHLPRGGVAPFFEPEYARAMLDGTPLPPPSRASEQYGLAALLYGLITGASSTHARLDRAGFLASVCADPPRPFSQHGLPPWPEIESVLSRALAKSPGERFPSVRAFADALEQAGRAAIVASNGHRAGAAYPMVTGLLERLRRDPIGEPLPGPAASVNYGAAGIAYLCYRAAGALGRGDLLDAAELWLERAKRDQTSRDAFYHDQLGITESTVGRRALYHCAPGVHVVETMVAASFGNLQAAAEAAAAFDRAAELAGPQDDLTTGTAGLLLGYALLTELLPARLPVRARLLRRGQQASASILAIAGHAAAVPAAAPAGRPDQSGRSDPRQLGPGGYLGIAHGQAGLLYALLQWSLASGQPLAAQVPQLLASLLDLGESHGRQRAWPRTPGDRQWWTGWCHGTTGYALLWCAAYDAGLGDGYLEAAAAAGWHASARASRGPGHLCCGAAGQAYAMLALYNRTGESNWLLRARQLHETALGTVGTAEMRPLSLYKGEVGVACLELDLGQTQWAAMPLFQPERWSARTG
jgi:eukaryotic-like serine/threonine-protein kinase